MTKAELEKVIDRARNIYAFYPENEKIITRARTQTGYQLNSANKELIGHIARIAKLPFIETEKVAEILITISDI